MLASDPIPGVESSGARPSATECKHKVRIENIKKQKEKVQKTDVDCPLHWHSYGVFVKLCRLTRQFLYVAKIG